MSLRHFVFLAFLSLSAGCLPNQRIVVAQEREAPGIVYLVSGIGGISPLVPSAKIALPMAGVKHELREFSWQHGKGRHLRDLQDTPHIHEKAEELAKQIRELHEREPDRRIYLVGHSAGTAIVIHAAELLPPQTVERIVLLSSALSPGYNLTGALRATRGEIVSFYSQLDRMVLWWGTNQFGTTDRNYGPAAGLNGFKTPDQLDDEGKRLYERLVQVPWTLDKALEFQTGGHHSTTTPWFLGRRVAPWLRDPAASDTKSD